MGNCTGMPGTSPGELFIPASIATSASPRFHAPLPSTAGAPANPPRHDNTVKSAGKKTCQERFFGQRNFLTAGSLLDAIVGIERPSDSNPSAARRALTTNRDGKRELRSTQL